MPHPSYSPPLPPSLSNYYPDLHNIVMPSLHSFRFIAQMSVPSHYSLVLALNKSFYMCFKSPLIFKVPIHPILFLSVEEPRPFDL